MAIFTIKKGGDTHGTSTQEPSTKRTQEVRKQETSSTSSKQKAIDAMTNEWKVGDLARTNYYVFQDSIVAINSIFYQRNGFPLISCTIMDDKYTGEFVIPLKYLRRVDE
jgi:hypothetical protein